jgi:hypothetical protein
VTEQRWMEVEFPEWERQWYEQTEDRVWLKSHHEDNVGGDRFFILTRDEAYLAFAVSSSDDMYGFIFTHEGKEVRDCDIMIDVVEQNLYANAVLCIDLIDDNATIASEIERLRAMIEPHYKRAIEDYKAKSDLEDQDSEPLPWEIVS